MELCLPSLRRQFGLTQKDVARLLDISVSTVSRWENGKQPLKVRELEQLMQAIRTSQSTRFSQAKRLKLQDYIQIDVPQDEPSTLTVSS